MTGERPAPTPRRPRAARFRAEAAGLPLAGLGARFLAHLLDAAIYLGLFFAGIFLIGVFAEPEPTAWEDNRDETTWEEESWRTDASSNDDSNLVLLVLIAPIAFFVFQAYLLTTRGQTIGKIVLKTRIVDHHSGAHPGFARIVLMRSVVPGVISQFCGLFGLIDALYIFGDQRRTVHDYMAGTSVVDARAVPQVRPDVFD